MARGIVAVLGKRPPAGWFGAVTDTPQDAEAAAATDAAERAHAQEAR